MTRTTIPLTTIWTLLLLPMAAISQEGPAALVNFVQTEAHQNVSVLLASPPNSAIAGLQWSGLALLIDLQTVRCSGMFIYDQTPSSAVTATSVEPFAPEKDQLPTPAMNQLLYHPDAREHKPGYVGKNEGAKTGPFGKWSFYPVYAMRNTEMVRFKSLIAR